MANTLFILNEAPYGNERSYNGLRLAGSLVKQDTENVRMFLMGDAVACAKQGQKVPKGYYKIENMLQAVGRNEEIGACGTCMDARGITVDELAERIKRSTLDELTQWTLWADHILVF